MSIVTRLLNRLRLTRLDRDIHDEVAFHIEMRTNQHVTAGMTSDEAKARARQQFGDVSTVEAEMRTHASVR